MVAEWYFKIADREMGPVPAAQLAQMAKSGRINPADLVRKGSQGPWIPAGQIKGLTFQDTPPIEPEIPPLPTETASAPRHEARPVAGPYVAASETQAGGQAARTPPSRRPRPSRKKLSGVLLSIVIAGVALSALAIVGLVAYLNQDAHVDPIVASSRDNSGGTTPPTRSSTASPKNATSNKSLARAAAESVLEPNSSYYRVAGFKTLRWGEPKDVAERKAREFAPDTRDKQELSIHRDTQELFFDDKERLVGYRRLYRKTNSKELAVLFRQTFGAPPDAEEPTTNDSTRMVFRYIFPETRVSVAFAPSAYSHLPPEASLFLFDRGYLLDQTTQALQAALTCLPLLRSVSADILAVERPVRNFPKIADVIEKTVIEEQRGKPTGVIKYVASKKVWHRNVGVFDWNWLQVDKDVFAVTQVTSDYRQERADDQKQPGFVAVTVWIDSFVNTKEYILSKRHVSGSVERGICELVLTVFPSKNGSYVRKIGNSEGAAVHGSSYVYSRDWYEWEAAGDVKVQVVNDGHRSGVKIFKNLVRPRKTTL